MQVDSPSARPDVRRLVESNDFVPREPSSVSREPNALAERLEKLLVDDPALFLERYGDACTPKELLFFDAADDYEVKWHLSRLRRSYAERASTKKNRRFRCLRELEEGDGLALQRKNSLWRSPIM